MVNRQKILIVDDDSNIAELISLYLTKECFETMTTGDGEDSDSDRTNIADESTWSGIESDSHGQYEIISDDGRVLVSDTTK